MATFSVGQVLTAAQMNSIANLSVRAVTATSDTLVVTDADNKLITYANTGTTTITVPAFTDVSMTTGSVVNVIKIASGGTVSIIQGAGVTIASSGAISTSPVITAQYKAASLVKVSTDSWYIVGGIA